VWKSVDSVLSFETREALAVSVYAEVSRLAEWETTLELVKG
jgi:hypothetical protein